MNTYTINADEKTIKEIVSYFAKESFLQPQQYQKYLIKTQNVTIAIYNSNKIVIQGKEAQMYYDMFAINKDVILPQAGSDEVGTGDYFGPIIVCSCYINENDYQKIKKLRLTDSKQLSDQYILETIDKLKDQLTYSVVKLSNENYNQAIKKYNMNQIKAMMHNRAYLNLAKKVKLPKFAVVDDFCGEDKYFQYLKNETEVYSDLHFETKAESKYLAVGIASMIARYTFLKEMEILNNKYKMNFPKGAGQPVDKFIKEFVNKYSINELSKVAKLNFKNTIKNSI